MSEHYDPRFVHLPPPPSPPPFREFRPPVPPGPWMPPPGAEAVAGPGVRRRVEVDVRNLVLTLGVLSLVAAAVSFCALHWESFDASMRASLLVGVTVLVFVGCLETAHRGLSGTATALSWLTAVLGFVDLAAVLQALPAEVARDVPSALGFVVLFGVFVILGTLYPGGAMRTGASISWLFACWSALSIWNVTGVDVWVLPVAFLVGWFQVRSCVGRPDVTSWHRYGAALMIATVPAVLVTLADPGTVRPLVVIALALVVLVAGIVLRQLAAIWVAGCALGVIVAAQLFEALRGIPGWAVFALVGSVLIAVGACFESVVRRTHSDQRV